MAAKLIVTTTKGGSRITLVGTSGTELLTSKVFAEPRAKGATLRSLKGLLGDDVVVEDQTVSVARKPADTPSADRKVVAPKAAAAKRTSAKAPSPSAPPTKVSTRKSAVAKRAAGKRVARTRAAEQ